MKITKSQLKELFKEELQRVLQENEIDIDQKVEAFLRSWCSNLPPPFPQ